MPIWVNVSTIANWSGNPVGIARVEYELCGRLLENADARAFTVNGNKIVPSKWSRRRTQNDVVASPSSQVTDFFDRPLGGYGLKVALHVNHLQQQSLGLKFAHLGADLAALSLPNTPEARATLGHFTDALMRRYLNYRERRSRKSGIEAIEGRELKTASHKVPLGFQADADDSSSVVHPFQRNDAVISMGLDWDTGASDVLARARRDVAFSWINCVYDLIPVDMPHSVGNDYLRDILLGHFTRLVTSSDSVWCISATTELRYHHFAARLGAPTPRTTAIPLANENGGRQERNRLSRRFKFVSSARPFILSVGTFEVRKNYATLVNAMYLLAESHQIEDLPLLVIVGQPGWLAEDTRHRIKTDPRLSELVIHLEDVSDDDLWELYESASGFVSASEAEGFGLPVAEALSAKLPCVVSDIPTYHELFPDLRKVSPYDSRAWAEAILDLVEGRESVSQRHELRTWESVYVDLTAWISKTTNLRDFQG